MPKTSNRYQKKTKPAIWREAFPAQAAALRPGKAEAEKGGRRPFQPRKRRLGPAKHGARRPRTLVQTFLAEEKKLYREEARNFIAAANEKGEFCQVVWTLVGTQIPVEEVHHTRGRGHGGRSPLLRDQRFWLAVSSRGHRWIHDNQNKAREYGWLCEKGQWNVFPWNEPK